MGRAFATFLFLGCVTLLASGATAAKPDYYPLNIGVKWTYDVVVGGNEIEISSEVAKLEKIDDKPLARIDTSIDGVVVTTEHMSSTDAGIYRNRYNGADFSPAVCILKYPVKEDESWEGEVKVGAETFKYSARVLKAKDQVEVPAGKYDAVKVEVKLLQNKQAVDTIYWFADGVGVVQQEATLDKLPVTTKLKKFEKGK